MAPPADPRTPFIFKKTIVTTSYIKTLPVKLESKRFSKTSKSDEIKSALQNALAHNVPVSPSGRTLKTILSLGSTDLSSYSIGNVTMPELGPWAKPVEVEISSREKDFEVLRKRVQELETIVKDMKGEMKDMQARSKSQEVTVIGWQAASQVFDELAKFVWTELPVETKTSLEVYSIFDFRSLNNSQHLHPQNPATGAAQSAYATIHRDVREAIATVSKKKNKHGDERSQIAHPKVPRRDFEILINSLSPGSHHHVFDYLRSMFL